MRFLASPQPFYTFRDVRSGPIETATYVYFRHVRAKVTARHNASGIFGMTESRRHSFLVQSCCTKQQARKSPPASKPAAYSSIVRFQPHTLNKQGIDRASVHQLAIQLRSNNRSRIVRKDHPPRMSCARAKYEIYHSPVISLYSFNFLL